MDGNQNAEAGPSKPRPRPLLPSRPVPDPPPATPPSTSKSAKRRSWFGISLGSPSIISNPNYAEDGSSMKKDRRTSTSSVRSNIEELELASVISNNSSSKGKGRESLEINQIPEGSRSSKDTEDGEEEELLTIDGDPEKTVKKKKRKSKGKQEDFDVMRMNDLGGHGNKGPGGEIYQNNQTPRSVSDRTVKVNPDNQETPQLHTQPYSIRQRTFSRTASDRDPFTPPEPIPPLPASTPTITPRSSSSSITNHKPEIYQRTSKSNTPSNSYSSSPRILSLQIDKNQPPIPFDFDRPLPPLPSLPSLPSKKSQSSFQNKHDIPIPKGIVVTPSSPRKLSKTPKKPTLTQRRSRSANGYPRDSLNQDKRSQSIISSSNPTPGSNISPNLTPGSNIGLGLPSSLLPSSKTTNANVDSPPPPPVPSKPQSVSSPFPSRSPSPIPKIAFIEPDGLPPKIDDPPQEEKRKVIRRARSLSGFFGRSPVITQDAKVDDGSHTPEQDDTKPGESVGKSGGGVLEWLGVRKPSKRKLTDNQTKAQMEGGNSPVISQEESKLGQQDHSGSRESLGTPSLPSAQTVSESQQPTPRKPQYNLSPSATPTIPSTGTNKISNIFARRASARTTDDESEQHPIAQVVPMNIPNAGMRNQTARSSESSFHLPAHDPISPFIPGSGPWVSTPQSEKEETLFSPPEGSNWGPGRRPWMDGGERQNSSRSSISSQLDPLPEQEPPPTHAPLKAPPTFREGRVRSWSDAPLPPQKLLVQGSNPHLPLPRPSTPNGQSASLSLSSSPQTPSRPRLGDRANSGNSAIIGRMRSVFSKSTNRSRSNSLLRKGSSEIDEFGNIPAGLLSEAGRSQRMRPSTSSSSVTSSSMLRGRSIGDDNTRPGGVSNQDNQEQTRSPRTSFTPSISSLGSRPEILLETKTARKSRVRASTISLAPTSYNFTGSGPPPRPISPNLYPISATPPRRRPGTIHRISNGLFGSSSSSGIGYGSGSGSIGPSSPKNGSLFPLPARSSGSVSSSTTTNGYNGFIGWEDGGSGSNSNTNTNTTNGFLSTGTSPRPSTGSISVTMTNSQIKQISQREGEEEPNQWLERIVNNVSRDEIANVLASSGDEFYTEALRLYMATFDFTHNALDVALRRLLMHMSLPKETQQIDRVIEAFSRRYEECEPGLFGSKDNTYVLAFSMMMLHTDAFNKSNKNKMTKVDYVRNTRMEGVPPIVLEAFFDNITYTPFIFIEDDIDLKRSSGYESTSSTFGPSTPTFSSGPLLNGSSIGSSSVGSTNNKTKIDVYHMIIRGLLGTLRIQNLENQIPTENNFSYNGTRPFLNLDELCEIFSKSNNLIIPSYIATQNQTNRKVSGGKLITPARRYTVGAKDQNKNEDLVLRVVKVGLLSRKDDTDQSSKKASRKWKSWSVILTSSQLLFFKDPTWALTLLEQIRSTQGTDKAGQLLLPRQTTFKPDEVFSLKDCVAVFDRSFTAYPNTFRFVMPQSRQYLLQSSDEYEMNEWIALINYASSFKTVNLKMKGPTMRKDQVVLAGAAAAASHKREMRDAISQSPLASGKKAVFGESNNLGLGLFDNTSAQHNDSGINEAKAKVKNGSIDLDEGNEVVHEGEQLEEVFGVVKAELAAGRGEAGSTRPATPNGHSGLTSERPSVKEKQHIHTSRVSIIYEHLNDLRKKCIPIETSLRATLLLIRNIAILTPFQKSTRDRLSSSIPSLATKIRNDRLNLIKLKLWIKVLEYEGEREDREWKVVRHVALQAAARSLREDTLDGVVKDINRQSEDSFKEIPKLTLDLPETQFDPQQNDRRELTTPGELPEFIRKSSDDSPITSTNTNTNMEKRKQSTSDQINRKNSITSNSTSTSINKGKGIKIRKSNSASDLLNPSYNEFRRSSEIEETQTHHPQDSMKSNPSNSNSPYIFTCTDSPDAIQSNKKTLTPLNDTPMMIFTMESPLEVPSDQVAKEVDVDGNAAKSEDTQSKSDKSNSEVASTSSGSKTDSS